MAAKDSRYPDPNYEESTMYDPVEEAKKFIRMKCDKKCLRVKQIDNIKGKGVFASRDFNEGEFLLDYDGELVPFSEGQKRMKDYPPELGSFLYLFPFKNKKYWIDGTYSKKKGKYVNDAPHNSKENNAIMKSIEVDGVPHLALFAKRKISKGEELHYDYGEENLPWRKKEPNADEKSKSNETELLKVKPCFVELKRLDLPLTCCTEEDRKASQAAPSLSGTSITTEYVEEPLMTEFREAPQCNSGSSYSLPGTSLTTECLEDPLMEEGDRKAPQGDSGSSPSLQYTSFTTESVEEHPMQASVQVEKIWSQKSVTDFILANVFGINITDRDIKSLHGTNWLTDQVIDAYLKLICQAEIDKGRPIMQIPVQAMTAICTGSFSRNYTGTEKKSAYFSKHLLTLYEVVLGVCHQGGNHWTLVVVEPSKGNFYLFDPFGYDEHQATRYLLNWSDFLKGRKMEKDVTLKVNNKDQSVQRDGYNCGVFCLMFAERFLRNQFLTDISSSDLAKARQEIAENLLQYELVIKHACPCCGIKCSDEQKIPCISCKRNFHKKSHCVGDEYTAEEITSILCRGCNQKMLVQDDENRFEQVQNEVLHTQYMPEIAEIDVEYSPAKSVGMEPFERLQICAVKALWASRFTTVDKDDKFVCGKCDSEFRDIGEFLSHKRTLCLNMSTSPVKTDKVFSYSKHEDSSEGTTSHLKESSVTVTEEKNENVAERKKTLKRPCPFCMKMQASLTKHIERCHKDEEEVKTAMNLPRPEKNRAFCNMKRQGIFKYNANIMKTKEIDSSSVSELMKERNQSKKKIALCSHCNAFINKSLMYRHARICTGARETTLIPTGVELRALQETEFPKDYMNFLEKFHLDEVGQVVRSDEFLKQFGHYEFKHLSQSNFKVVEKMHSLRSKLRRLARLFIHFKNIASNAGRDVKSCDELFRTETIGLLDEAVTKMTHDSESGNVKSGLKVGLRSLILEVCNSIYLTFSLKLEKQKAMEIMEFEQVLKLYWKRYFNTAQEALANKRHSESRAPRRLPSDDDIKKLNNFIKNKVQSIVENVYTPMNLNLFCQLRNLLTCRLTLFNARRGGEAARLTLAEFKDAVGGKWVNDSSAGKLDEDTDMMCKLKCTYLHSSKKAELVPLIIPEDCWKGLEMLADVESRELAHINPNNLFIFANTGNSTDHVNGWQCVRDVCEQADISRSITATDMRHYVATLYAALDVPQDERDFFIQKHLGHSKFINENVYQCPPTVKELRVAGKFLTGLDSHKVQTGEDISIDNVDDCEKISNYSGTHGNKSGVTHGRRRKSHDMDYQPPKKSRKDMDGYTTDETSGDDSESDYQSINEEEFNAKSKTSKTKPRHQWSKEEDTAIQEFFSDEINDVSQQGNKGKLIIDTKVKQFIKQHPKLLQEFSDSEKKTKIRVKVCNCRRRTREIYFKNLNKLKERN